MKILHCCLSCFYIDNYNYQENILPRINKEDGHEVKIIASTETFIGNSELGYIEPKKYFNKDGIEIIRIPYKKYLPQNIMKKIRHYDGVEALIANFAPDIIMFHGVSALELLTIVKYKKKNPHVKIYVDSHTDKNNSAKNWVSQNILHKGFYKNILKYSLPYIDKVFYITNESKSFLQDIYKINEGNLEYYPLGGTIINIKEKNIMKEKIRSSLKLNTEDILIVHSGKIDSLKRTQELIEAFLTVKNEKLKLVIIGSIHKSLESSLKQLINSDNRIIYLGWRNSEELLEYLSACDLYIQPGSQSVTAQNALCSGAALAVYPHISYKSLMGESIIYVESKEDIIDLFKKILSDSNWLNYYKAKGYERAKEVLDYQKLASRLYM